MSTSLIEKVWASAQEIENFLRPPLSIADHDQDMLAAARGLATRIEMHADGCGDAPDWRHLEKLGRGLIIVLEQITAIGAVADNHIANAHGAAGWIDQECGKEAAKQA